MESVEAPLHDGTGPAVPYSMRALGNRNFRIFAAGQIVSLAGTWMQMVAQSWLVYRLTGSSLLLGSVAFASQAPVLLFGPLGGLAADRFDRRRVVMAAQAVSLLQAAVLAALTLLGCVQIWHVFALAALLGAVNAFDIPARQAYVTDMVGRKDLINAVALNSSTFNAARIIGPAAAGVLVASVGEGWCFLANAASFVPVIIGLMLIDTAGRPRPGRDAPAVESLLEGLRFVRGAGPVRAILVMLGAISFAGMPYAVLMPIFAGRILHGGARGLGILMAATGVGALFGALSLAGRSGVRGLMRLIALSCAGFGASLLLFSLSRSFWLSAALLVPAGFCLMVQMGSSNTLIQSMVPDAMRGRVMSLYSMVFMGASPLGALLAGALADVVGAPATVAACGFACLAGAAWFASRLRIFRPEVRRLVLAQEEAQAEPAA